MEKRLKEGKKMKKLKFYVSILLTVVLLASCFVFTVSAESADDPTFELSVTEEGKKSDGVSFDELVRYYGRTDIDTDWTKCEFEFTLDPELVFQNGTVSVEYRTEGSYNYVKIDSAAYTVSAVEDQKFTVSIDDFSFCEGKIALRAVFKIKLDKGKTAMGESVCCSAVLNFTKGGVSGSVEADTVCEIYTGGYKFQRVGDDDVTPVAGAKYGVYMADYDILLGYITSDSEGNFEAKGLNNGDYYLLEMSVPDGTESISEKIYFAVTKTSYDESERLKISSFSVVLGDLNDDGRVTVIDLLIMKKILVNGNKYGVDLTLCDLNGDSKFTSADVLALVKILKH